MRATRLLKPAELDHLETNCAAHKDRPTRGLISKKQLSG
jgi:hypothetical protein